MKPQIQCVRTRREIPVFIGVPCTGRRPNVQTAVRANDAGGISKKQSGIPADLGCGRPAPVPILVYEYLRASPRKRRLGYEEMLEWPSRGRQGGARSATCSRCRCYAVDGAADVPVRDGRDAARSRARTSPSRSTGARSTPWCRISRSTGSSRRWRSAREGRQPERTTYRITDAGRAELTDWLRELISEPEREYTRFEAALGECGVLSPDELIGLLRQRLEALEEATAAHQEMLDAMEAQLPRLFLIESEYQLALRRAETEWVRGPAHGAHRRHLPRAGGLAALPRDRGVPRGAHPVAEPGRRTGGRQLSKRPRPGAATPAAGAVKPQSIPRNAKPEVPPTTVAGFALAGQDRKGDTREHERLRHRGASASQDLCGTRQ